MVAQQPCASQELKLVVDGRVTIVVEIGPEGVMERVASNDRVRSTFEAEHGRLWRSVLAYTGDPEVASDAVAEAFAQALRRGDAVRDPQAWVWRAAFRIAAGQLSERRESGRAGLDAVRQPSTDTLPDEVVALLDALGRLAAVDRQVVVLILVGGLSAAEVGGVVDASAGAIRVRLHRARARLRETLTDEGAPDSAASQEHT
jgi:RNA polymerase sigma-70 factor (ECF subfamily)